MRDRRGYVAALALAVALTGCASTSNGNEATGKVGPSELSEAPSSPWVSGEPFPTAAFSDLSEDPVSADAAAGLWGMPADRHRTQPGPDVFPTTARS